MVLTVSAALLAAGCATGALLLLLGLAPGHAVGSVHLSPRAPRFQPRALRPSHLLALSVGLIALVITRWPLALPLGAGGVLAMQGLGPGGGADTIAALESIAVWSEMLRDTLAGASGLSQALIATAETAPLPLRPAVTTLARRLEGGVALERALRELADALADPAADMVVAALVMASKERAQRLGELLSALATSVRDEVGMRLRIEASRASSRTAVRMITGFSLALFAVMALFARAYLAPYSSATGQLVLALVGGLFALGLWLMASMIRPKLLPRLELSEREQ